MNTDDAASDRPVGRRALLVGAAGTIAGLAGCLGNPFEPGAEEEREEEEEKAEEEPTPEESAGNGGTNDAAGGGDESGGDDSGGQSGPPEPDIVVDVAADAFSFSPEQFDIAVGQTVKWVWQSGGHNVRVDSKPDGSEWSGTAGSATDTYPEGHELVSTFETPGEYEYYCAPHRSLGLEGSFTVVEG